MTKNKKFNWINKVYSSNISSLLLNKEIFNTQANIFFNDLTQTNNFFNSHIIILFRVQFTNNEIATFGNLQRFNLETSEINEYINYISKLITYKDDHYRTDSIKNFIFSYSVILGKTDTNIKDIIPNKLLNEKNDYLTFYQYKLPIAFNPFDYDKVVKFTNYDFMIPLKDGDFIKIKVINKTTNKCILYHEDKIILEYTDTKLDDNTFVRKINNNKYTFILGKLELMESDKKTKFINPLINKNKNSLFNFLTLDIETYLDSNNYQVPYCICIYDGSKSYSFYLDGYNSPEDMLITAIKSISIRKFNNFNIYAHNFSNFDGIFLLKVLNKLGIIQPTIKDGRLISVNFSFCDNNNIYNLKFFDSILLLNSSLRKLAKSFNTITQKGNFEVTKIKEDNYKLFKDEVVKYCIDDCISLYQILIKFNELIYNKFNIKIKNYPTLPSLTFANYRTNYLEEDQIAQISGKIHSDIRKSYTGGSTDMFIPFNQEELLYLYDVNSLYPYVMKEFEYPIGSPTYFEGDIRKINNDAFGIFYCEITSPKYLEHPIIQSHVKTKSGIRTLSPLGNWFDWITSVELDNAKKFGYKFKIIKGYTFNKGRPFTKFIDELYQLRLNYPKSDPMNYIGKLLLNSLYGRFGMNDDFNEIRLVNNNELNKLTDDNKIVIKDIFNLDKDDFVVQIKKNEEQQLISLIDNLNENHNVNIAIASFVTSYARIHMTQFKNNKELKLYYTDTDSAVTNKPLPGDLVDNKELGKFKLEHIILKGIFLAPKLYCLLTSDNELITKTRGLTHDIKLNLQDYENLLFKDSSLVKSQNKWFKNMYEGTIKIDELPYEIKYTDNKRKLIFDEGKLVNTKPFTINSKKEII